MVSLVDLIPTLIDAAGGTAPEGIDGRSFLPVLLGESDQHREQIFTTHSGDLGVNVYPIRAVRSREWKFIHNLNPEFAFTNHSDLHRKRWAGAYWTEPAALAKTDPAARAIVDRYYQRPEFELFRVSDDKWEQQNLAADPAYATILAELQSDLAAWREQQGDAGRIFAKPRLLAKPETWHPDHFNALAPAKKTRRKLGHVPKQPNILIIVADDLGYADTGFNGGKTAKTPHLDRFAKSGIRLSDFRACPMCSPTRAGLLTGRWPIRFGMMRAVIPPWSKYGIPAEEGHPAGLLADAGYERRGIFGKWHLGHTKLSHLPPQNGFTHFIGHYNGAIDYFSHEREGELDWHEDQSPLREEGYDDLIGEHAAAFIRDSPEAKPYFLYVPFNAPHSPYQATAADLAAHHDLADQRRRTYAAMVTAMDRGIGRILAEVESRPDADNTLVIFFSDNGGILRVGSNAPYRGAKVSVYEGGTRVAAALRLARGLVGGTSFDGRIGYIDVLPSVLRAAGIRLPDSLDGIDFLPAVCGEAKLPERPWFSYMHQDKSPASSLHLGAWKLVAKGAPFDLGSDNPKLKLELYNLATDPGEKSDLAAEHPDRVTDMLAKLREFGRLQMPGATLYHEGRAGFTAPRDWLIRE